MNVLQSCRDLIFLRFIPEIDVIFPPIFPYEKENILVFMLVSKALKLTVRAKMRIGYKRVHYIRSGSNDFVLIKLFINSV